VSEVDVNGDVLATFTDINWVPFHLSLDNEGQLLVADVNNDRILLLNNQLQLLRIPVELWRPWRLHVNDVTSQLYVVHNSFDSLSPIPAPLNDENKLLPTVISIFKLQ